MPGLTIGWEYLTGYAVATDPSSRERAEWPPHPGRVFMAMAAAWFETGEEPAEGEALRWLETLGDPELHLPPSDQVAERSNVTFYVPVNDKADAHHQPDKKKKATIYPHLGSVLIGRNRQPRTFPRVYVGDASCLMHWPEAEDVDTHRDALDQLCAKVTRIGHSSSLVRMWVADGIEQDEADNLERWQPSPTTGSVHCRRISAGTLDALPSQTGIPRIEAFAGHVWGIEDAEQAAARAKADGDPTAKKEANRLLKQAKNAYEESFGEAYKKSASAPPRLRPTLGLWTGYRRADATPSDSDAAQSHFDTDLLVLTKVAGPTLPAVSTLAVTRALRGAVIKHSGIKPVPSWVSGHQADGSPCIAEHGHLAYIALPVVGHEHADGHLMGLGLVFPRAEQGKEQEARIERGKVLGPLLIGEDGLPRERELPLGRLGVWKVKKREWSEHRKALQPETWTAQPKGEQVWASATPVVLDRFPKTDRSKDRAGWTDEVKGIIAEACKRIGLPEPVEVGIDTTCWQRGGERAVGQRRPLRQGNGASQGTAALGGGFPFYPAKGTNAPRPQVHVWLAFDQPVLGPILLGAGRYMGYGLCKPMTESKGARR